MLSKLASHMVGSRESGAVCFNWTGSTTDIRTETMTIEAEERVSDHSMAINGELVQSSAGLSDPVINPATGEVFGACEPPWPPRLSALYPHHSPS